MTKKKKVAGIGIILLTIAAMLCVWPICLARRSTELSSMTGIAYTGTRDTLRQGGVLEQIFIAQASELYSMSFVVGFDEDLPEDGSLRFVLEELKDGEILVEQEVPFSKLGNFGYCDVEVNRHIKKGAEYRYTITVPDSYAGLLRGVYTTEPGQEPRGNSVFRFNGKEIDGQAVTRYYYGFPLNVKNIVCIYAFLLVMGLTLLRVCGWSLPEGKKAERLIDRFSVPLLVIAVLGTTALVVRICFNEAVHWDEAFTWQLITRNNVPGILAGTAGDVHPPLYYLVAKAAITLFGQNIFVVKMVSVGAAVCSMILCAVLFRRQFGIRPALLMIPVIGLGPQFIHYNVDCRMYSMMIFFVFGAALFAYEIVRKDKLPNWILFTLFSLGGVYTQYFAVAPLVLIYFYLLIQLVKIDRRKWKKWLLCCIATVAAYLPWLGVVIGMFRSETGGEGSEIDFGFVDFLGTIFKTNIEYSAFMPFILFLLCVFVLVLEWKRYGKREREFLLLSGSLLWVVELVCLLIASRMSHFWTERYIVDAIVFVWILIAVILSRQGLVIWGVFCIWEAVMVLSSYTVTKATELNTVPWTENAKEVLAEAQGEEIILYNFPTYDVLYSYWLPNAEFVWMDEMDFSQLQQDYVYMLYWGGQNFDSAVAQKWNISMEKIGTVRFEAGMAGIDLVKVHFSSASHEKDRPQ